MSPKPAQPANSVTKPTPRAEFDLPEEDTTTALADKDRTYVVDLQTGKEVPEPVARDKDEDNLILVCLDPKAKSGQSEAALQAAIHVAKPGDRVILMTVLPLHVYSDAIIAPLSSTYDINYQVDTLRQMRSDRVKELTGLAKSFPEGVLLYARVVHGGVERQILRAAQESNCSLVIIGKRKLGIWQKLVTPSVSSWVVSKAPCAVLVAK